METSFFFLFECQGGEVEGLKKKKKVTVRVGSRVCHGKDSGSSKSEVRVNLVFTVVIFTHTHTHTHTDIESLDLECARYLLTISDRICLFLLGRYQWDHPLES